MLRLLLGKRWEHRVGLVKSRNSSIYHHHLHVLIIMMSIVLQVHKQVAMVRSTTLSRVVAAVVIPVRLNSCTKHRSHVVQVTVRLGGHVIIKNVLSMARA